ncbi:MAG TPA: response regulator transcription factor [Candidatus Limnocylindria bacterium]
MLADGSPGTFSALCALDLGVPLFRVRDLDHRRLPVSTLLLLDATNGLDSTIERVRATAEDTVVMVVGRRIDPLDALAYVSAGAFGAIDLDMDRAVLRRVVAGALRGEPAFSREVLGQWFRDLRSTSDADARSLTERQHEVLNLVARGATDKEISTTLGISVATAQKHVASTLRKLGARNRAAAVSIVLRGSLLAWVDRSGPRPR